jgi:SpoVK/Ycf46/Vps4 family AAA+-type ATPase
VAVFLDGKVEVLNIPLKHRLYVIEDIDAMHSIVLKRSADQLKQEQEHKLKLEAEMELLKQTQGEFMARNMVQGKDSSNGDKLDLATLLNVLDGVRETPGRIIILSTNYPERLDEALLRPGRFDMMLEFQHHSCAVLQYHLEKHYDTTLTKEQLAQVYMPTLEKKWTPAEVSQILFRCIGDLEGAIQLLVHETPAKLFRFSQLQTEDRQQQTSDQTNKEKQQQQTEDTTNQEEQSTLLEDLVQPTAQNEELPETLQHFGKEYTPNAAEVFKDCKFDTASILFSTHADLGLLSANDNGLPVQKHTAPIPEIEVSYNLPQDQLGFLPADQFGLAAANEGDEPALDDFFPLIE